jgi:hypothetical protein
MTTDRADPARDGQRKTAVARSTIVQAHRDLLDKVARKIPGHDPTRDCWACGSCTDLQRCRVVAIADGGEASPANTWLLCSECHYEQPDGARAEGQRHWILEHEVHDDRLVRLALEVVTPVMTRPRANEWAAARLLDEQSLAQIVAGVRERIARAHLQSVRTSLRYDLVADYEEWIARRRAPGGTKAVPDVGDAVRRRIEKMFADTPALIPNIHQVLGKLKREGKYAGAGVPYGYELGGDGKTLSPNAVEQRVIAEARELHAGKLSLRAIAEKLKTRGMRARNGRPFEAVQIKRMIRNHEDRNVT